MADFTAPPHAAAKTPGPLVTAVIPTYNRAHLIAEALDSVAAQTWRPIEIVLVDDGSTDGTQEIVERWAAAHADDIPLTCILQANSGGNVARNRGVAHAAGDFIAFLDSDDLWHPDKIARQMAVMTAEPDCVAVYCGLREVSAETGAVLRIPNRPFPQGNLLKELLVRDATAPTSAYLVRADSLEAAGAFDTELRARQDWDLWIRLALQGKIRAVPEPLMDLRHHSGPRTISDPTRELAAHRTILNKYKSLRRKTGLVAQLRAEAAYHRRAGRVKLRHMRAPVRALGHYLLAIAIWPFAPDSYAALLGWFLPGVLRRRIRLLWNGIFGKTPLAIRNH